MAAFVMESADIGTQYTESLAGRLAGGALGLPYALLCATDVALALRGLHQKDIAHGAVRTDSIRVSDAGATLAPRGARIRGADRRSDVAGFGAVLYEMLTGWKPPHDVATPAFTPIQAARNLEDVRRDALKLAVRCLDGSPEMRQVVIELRVLRILARGLSNVRYRLQVVPKREIAECIPPPESPITPAPEAPIPSEDVTLASAAGQGMELEHQFPIPDSGAESPPLGRSRATVCARCHGEARLVRPHSFVDRLLNRFGHLRQCDRCGYRFIVLRFRRQRI